MMVSPAVGWNHNKNKPLKQCLKNTWRQAQKTCHCLSFSALVTRSAGVGEVGTSSLVWVHLQMGGGEVSLAQEVNAESFRGVGKSIW